MGEMEERRQEKCKKNFSERDMKINIAPFLLSPFAPSSFKKGHKKRQIHRYDLPTLASIKTWGIQRELVICRHKDGGFC
jgi:hypothetical protein